MRSSSSPRQPGRPRDPAHSGEILRATQELLAEVGYDQLTIDAVAARAGVTRPTIYRRWASKAALVVDAVSTLRQPPGPGGPPDLGSVAAELHAVLIPQESADDFRMKVAGGLISAIPRHPELARLLHDKLFGPSLEMLRAVLERGVARGEIPPDRDLDLLASVFPAMLAYRALLSGQPPDAAFATAVIEQVLLPLVLTVETDPAAGRDQS